MKKNTTETRAQVANNKSKTLKLFRKIMPELMEQLEEEALKTDDVIVLHHVDTKMKRRDPERYSQFNYEDVVPMLRRKHISFHNKGHKHTKAHNRKISQSMKKSSKEMKFKGHALCLENKDGYVMYATSCAEAARQIGCSRQLVS